MKTIIAFAVGFWCTAVLSGATTIVTGCVKDASGKPVAKAKVFAVLEMGEKTYRAETKSDGCYEMHIKKDGVYAVGIRDDRFSSDGPIQTHITVSGLDLPNIDLSTAVPDARLLGECVARAVLSASSGFSRLRRGVTNSVVPEILGEIPSGFGHCRLQSSNGSNGPTAMWYCSTPGVNGIRDEHITHLMYETIQDSITRTVGGLPQLRYSLMKSTDEICRNCIDRAVWTSPINGIISLSQIKGRKGNYLVLWAAYNSSIADEGCASIRRNEEPKVDLAEYDSAIDAMNAEAVRQWDAALKAALRSLLFAGPTQQPGLTDGPMVSPNPCLIGIQNNTGSSLPENL
jgi:hypothetical protein